MTTPRMDSNPVRTLVCVDGSELAKKALHTAAALLRRLPLAMTVVHAFDPARRSTLPGHLLPEHIQHDMEPTLSRIRTQCEVRRIPPAQLDFLLLPQKMGCGKPGIRDGMIAYSETIRADLVVVGSWGLGGDKIDVLGSITDGVMAQIRTSVFVVKNTSPVLCDENTCFLVCIDGSKDSVQTAWFIRKLANRGDKIQLVTVCPVRNEKQLEFLDNLARDLYQIAPDDGVAVTFDLLEVPRLDATGVCAALNEWASAHGSDVIACAARGLSAHGGMEAYAHGLGTVSYRIARTSRIHTLITKPKA